MTWQASRGLLRKKLSPPPVTKTKVLLTEEAVTEVTEEVVTEVTEEAVTEVVEVSKVAEAAEAVEVVTKAGLTMTSELKKHGNDWEFI